MDSTITEIKEKVAIGREGVADGEEVMNGEKTAREATIEGAFGAKDTTIEVVEVLEEEAT